MARRDVYLDFETASDVDLGLSGAWVYSTHPSTSILCFALGAVSPTSGRLLPMKFATNMGLDRSPSAIAALRAIAEDPDCHIHAYNASFERYIWKNILTRKYGIPEIPLHRWHCSMARTSAMAVPRGLDVSGEFLQASVRKDDEGKRLMLQLCKMWAAPSCIPPADMQRLMDYCATDIEAEFEIDRQTVPLSPEEELVWQWDQTVNERGIKIDQKPLDRMISIAAAFQGQLDARICTATNGKIQKVTQIKRIKEYLYHEHGINAQSLDKEAIRNMLADPAIDDNVKTVINLRAAGGKTSNAKLEKMKAQSVLDDLVRGALIYHGAGTGRWVSEGIQMQNIPKGIKIDVQQVFDDVVALTDQEFIDKYEDRTALVLSSMLRGLIIPPAGKKLLVADFSAIEARLVVWLAGSTEGIKRFQEYDAGLAPDPYVMMARDIFNDPSITKKDEDKRQLGKAAVLGCGYGMGEDKFEATCAKNGTILQQGLAGRAVSTYRTMLPEVPELWKNLEAAFRRTIQNQNTNTCNGVTYIWHEKIGVGGYPWIECILPSGRSIWYADPQIEMVTGNYGQKSSVTIKTYSKDIGIYRTPIWGGTLTENVVQAIARDIMTKSASTLEATGKYETVLTVHDELVTYADPSATTAEMRTIMRRKPLWAATSTVDVEAKEKIRYGK